MEMKKTVRKLRKLLKSIEKMPMRRIMKLSIFLFAILLTSVLIPINLSVDAEIFPVDGIIAGDIIWVDNNDGDNTRPDSVTLFLYQDGVELGSFVIPGGSWEFTGLNDSLIYTVGASAVAGYTISYSGTTITYTLDSGLTSVTVNKVWVDNDDADNTRPVSITFRLYRNSVEFDTATVSAPWVYTFDNLPRYDATQNLYEYTVTEVPVVGYSSTATLSSFVDGIVSFTFTNTLDETIVRESLANATKYIPYSYQLQTDDFSPPNGTLAISSGTLPNGLQLDEDFWEIYGVPTETGMFRFTVEAASDALLYENYELVVLEEPENNAYEVVDPGYEIIEYIGDVIIDPNTGIRHRIKRDFEDEIFISNGPFDEFYALWFNGDELRIDEDYFAEEGSTKITIRSQTFQKYNEGTHTIVAEFRTNEGELNITAQVVTVDLGRSTEPKSVLNANSATDRTAPLRSESVATALSQEVITTPDTKTVRLDIQSVIENGIARIVVTPEAIKAALAEVLNQTRENPGTPILLEIFAIGLSGDVTSLHLSMSSEGMRLLSEIDNISLRINADLLGTITLPNKAIKFIAGQGGNVIEVKIEQVNSVYVGISVDDILLESIDGGIRVMLAEPALGEVIVVLKTEGGEETVKKSVVENGFVYALLEGSGIVKVINNSKIFTDVAPGDWYYNAIIFANSRRLLNGVSETEMAPGMNMTRAMLATVLHNLENHEYLGSGVAFDDVVQGKWYSDGIAWASSAGIVSGYGNGLFGTNDIITREQLVQMIMNYAKHIGMETIERGDVSIYPDRGEVSFWANDAVRWSIAIGLLQGDGTGINPKGTATRAETATIIMNFINILVK